MFLALVYSTPGFPPFSQPAWPQSPVQSYWTSSFHSISHQNLSENKNSKYLHYCLLIIIAVIKETLIPGRACPGPFLSPCCFLSTITYRGLRKAQTRSSVWPLYSCPLCERHPPSTAEAAFLTSDLCSNASFSELLCPSYLPTVIWISCSN